MDPEVQERFERIERHLERASERIEQTAAAHVESELLVDDDARGLAAT
jgi:hypothetical protein